MSSPPKQDLSAGRRSKKETLEAHRRVRKQADLLNGPNMAYVIQLTLSESE